MALILLVDDARVTRKKLGDILKQLGHEIIEATDGLVGLEMAQTNHPDCIFTDLLMPDMDGYGLLKALQDSNISTPVIVMTADIQETSKQQCLALGARDVLNKPPSPDKVMQSLAKALL